MKKYILLLFMAITTLCNAQLKPLSVEQKGLDYMYDNEGDMFKFGGSYALSPTQTTPHAATTALTTLYTYTFSCPSGMSCRIREITMVSDGSVYSLATVNKVAQIPNLNTGRINNTYEHTFPTGGGSITYRNIDLDEQGNFTVVFTANSTANPNITIEGVGMNINNDYNFNARYSLLQMGDSQVWSNLGFIGGSGSVTNNGLSTYGRRLVEQMKTDGINVRLIQKGVSGIRASQYLYRVLSGELDNFIRNSVFIEIHLGTNDANAGTAASQNFQANMETIIDYCIKINPTASYLITGPPGTDVSATAANIGGYITIMSALPGLGKYAGKDIKFIDFRTAVPNPSIPSDPLYTETTTGTRLHARGDTGHLAQYNQAYPVLQTTTNYILAHP